MTMDPIALRGLAAWHAVVDAPSESALDALLAEDVVFHSPIVHSPQRGRPPKLYLMAAFQVLAGGGAGGGESRPRPEVLLRPRDRRRRDASSSSKPRSTASRSTVST
jgi:hypothetical protein